MDICAEWRDTKTLSRPWSINHSKRPRGCPKISFLKQLEELRRARGKSLNGMRRLAVNREDCQLRPHAERHYKERKRRRTLPLELQDTERTLIEMKRAPYK